MLSVSTLRAFFSKSKSMSTPSNPFSRSSSRNAAAACAICMGFMPYIGTFTLTPAFSTRRRAIPIVQPAFSPAAARSSFEIAPSFASFSTAATCFSLAGNRSAYPVAVPKSGVFMPSETVSASFSAACSCFSFESVMAALMQSLYLPSKLKVPVPSSDTRVPSKLNESSGTPRFFMACSMRFTKLSQAPARWSGVLPSTATSMTCTPFSPASRTPSSTPLNAAPAEATC